MGRSSPSAVVIGLALLLVLLLPREGEAKPRRAPVLDLERVRVEVVVDGPLVTTTIEQTWKNPGTSRQEIDVLLPVPADAAVTEYRMTVAGEALPAELLPRAQAKRAYTETVRRLQDPALLKHAGDQAVRARAFPVEAGASQTIRLTYQRVLKAQAGLWRHAVVPAPDRPEHDRIGMLDVNVEVKTGEPLVAIYSPTHDLAVRRTGDRQAVATHRSKRARPGDELLLYVATSPEALGMRVLTHRAPGEDGYFLLLGAPRTQAAKDTSAGRTVLFVFDRSGSMKGRKVEQVKAALRFCLHSLTAKDRFNLITFSDTVHSVLHVPMPATPASIDKALTHVRDIEADGGTNIQDALLTALDQVPVGEAADVVFLTDGLPTVGEKDSDKIRTAIKARNEGRARLFTFGVGDDVNITFLDKLALEAKGFPSVVRPTEDVEVTVSSFFRAITKPALRGLSLSADSMRIADLQPRDLPDLFHGSTLSILGRFQGRGPAKLILSGERDGTTVEIPVSVMLPEDRAENDFLPSLWAARKIGHLIDDIRASGPEPELVDQVVDLSLRHGIVTEYTAFLLDLETRDPAELREHATRVFREGGRAHMGGWAQSQARNKESMKRARSVRHAGGFEDREGRWVDFSSRVARIGRTVLIRDKQGAWVDTSLPSNVQAVELATNSEAYRRLVAQSDRFARIAALGAPVLVDYDGTVYRIVERQP